MYYLAFPKDSVSRKTLIYATYALESAQTFMMTNTAFQSFATGFGNKHNVDLVRLLWLLIPIINGLGSSFLLLGMPIKYRLLVALIVQVFYAQRIGTRSPRKYLAVLIVLVRHFHLDFSLCIDLKLDSSRLCNLGPQYPSASKSNRPAFSVHSLKKDHGLRRGLVMNYPVSVRDH